MDDLGHCVGHTAAGGKAHAGGGGLVLGAVVGHLLPVDALGTQHAPQLLEGQHEVHVAADGAAAGLQLLGGAGADEGDLAVGVAALLEPGRQHHGGHGHGDIRRHAGELLLGHHRPGGTAGGRHKGLLLRHVADELLRLLHRAQVGAHSHFLQTLEAQNLHGGENLAGGGLVAELAPEGGGDDGDDLVAPLDGMDELEKLALVHDGAEGAVHQAHAAADALIVVDLGAAVLVAADGVHAAGLGARALEADDGLVRAALLALAALDALGLVDVGLAMLKVHGLLGADGGAVVGKAALAGVGHLQMGGRAGVAGKLDDVDQRRLIILLGDGALLHAVGDHGMLLHIAQGQAHGQADALAHDGALQENGVPLLAHLAGDDLIGQLLHALGVVAAFVGHTGHLGEHALAHGGDVALIVTHKAFPLTV